MKNNKPLIVGILIVLAILVYLASTGKLGGEGTTFFAGQPDQGAEKWVSFEHNCVVDKDCTDFAVQNGAPKDMQAKCVDKICYAQVFLDIGGGNQ